MATMTTPTAASAAEVEIEVPGRYVDWGAIIAGTFVAAAISSVFLAFGSAIGLSVTSFQEGNSVPAAGMVIATALWLLWVQVSGFMGGGYIAGRMRYRIGDGDVNESEMRDGAHGLFVWAVGVVAGALIAGMLAVMGVAGGAVIAGQAASNSSMVDYYVDRMVRSEAAAPATSDTSTGTTTTTETSDTSASTQSQTQNQQMSRILTRSLGGTAMDDSDRSYLAREVSTRSGLAPAEAEKRVDDTISAMKAQADTARRYGILVAFLTATSLLLSAVGAWWAACAGGRHRNEGIDHTHFARWR